MRHFSYQNGEMYAETVPLRAIADSVGTPVYIYSTATLERHYQVFAQSFEDVPSLVAYSVKANSNLSVLATLAALGAGADVVSAGELVRARRAGIPASKIVFSGVGKTDAEIDLALSESIKVFNVESRAELEAINRLAVQRQQSAPIAFRINPDVSAGGHEKITTGKAENKFGIAWDTVIDTYDYAATLPGIEVVGIDLHLGSQISDLSPFESAIIKVKSLVQELRARGHNIRSFDLGGGLGIPYGDGADAPPLPSEYGDMVKRLTRDMDVELIFEPGRMIAGNAGVLLSKVIYIKEGSDRTFLILDTAMNDLIRPALYDAWHDIEPVAEPDQDAAIKSYDIVGPVCETGDTFAKARNLPELSAGELVVFHSAGAYGAVQSSQYNTRPLIPEVLVKGDQFDIIRRRPSFDDILDLEVSPKWMSHS